METSTSVDAGENLASRTPPASTASGEDVALLREELAEVRELARSLMGAVQEARAQAARVDSVRGALEDVKADVRAASHAIMAQPQSLAPAHSPATGHFENQYQERGCGPCQCVSSGCCAFDIKIWQVRAAKPQIEPADIGDIPGPTINALECQIYVTVDAMGVLIPGLSSCLDLRADAIPGGPGPWVVQNRVIQRVYVPKGATVTKNVKCEVLESDERLTELPFFKAELGEADGTITLDCCMAEIFAPMPIDVYLLHGGEGKGMVQVAIKAERVCC
jgi:hypothetical protein